MERKGLIPYDPSGNMPASYGEVQPSGFWKRITFGWQNKIFQVGKPEDGNFQREITFEPIFRYSGIKRNFENDWDPNAENVRPTCYSLDGKNGSVPQITRVLANGSEAVCYGECGPCAFNQWKSKNLWKPPTQDFKPGNAKQCSQYTLILAMYMGEVVVIQIPSTGVESVNDGIQLVVTQKDKRFEEVRWQLVGTGGGFQGKYMKINPMGFLTGEEITKLNLQRAQCHAQFEKTVLNFAQGGSDEEETPTTINGSNVVDA